jgi:hypothetical protein
MTARRAPAVGEQEPDPADLGTAFGLDASMAPEPSQTSPANSPSNRPVQPVHGDRLVRRPRR